MEDARFPNGSSRSVNIFRTRLRSRRIAYISRHFMIPSSFADGWLRRTRQSGAPVEGASNESRKKAWKAAKCTVHEPRTPGVAFIARKARILAVVPASINSPTRMHVRCRDSSQTPVLSRRFFSNLANSIGTLTHLVLSS